LFIASRRKDTRRERKKQQSEREKESATNGRTENERKEKHSPKARACVGEKKDFKNFQNATQRVYTHLLKERARKGSRPKTTKRTKKKKQNAYLEKG
jgi:hypothetical protein